MNTKHAQIALAAVTHIMYRISKWSAVFLAVILIMGTGILIGAIML